MRSCNKCLLMSLMLMCTLFSFGKEYTIVQDIPAEGYIVETGYQLPAMDKEAHTPWRAASPLGNGRIGLMVEGNPIEEVIHINEDSLWSGEPAPLMDGSTHKSALSKIRELIFKERHRKATQLGNNTMLGNKSAAYMPVGQLKLKLITNDKRIHNYQRTLHLNEGISTTSYWVGKNKIQREVFVSAIDQVAVIKISSEMPIALEISFNSKLEKNLSVENGLLKMVGRAPMVADPHYAADPQLRYDTSNEQKGTRFISLAQVSSNGSQNEFESQMHIENATEIEIRMAVETSYNGFNRSPSKEGKDYIAIAKRRLLETKENPYEKLKKQHQEDFRSFFDRVELNLTGKEITSDKPFNRRVRENYKKEDLELDELFYQMGRYLVISGSREGSQALNLQGIWSYKLNPSWSSNYTTNCNMQFNYIGNGVANLTELNEPLLRLVEEAAVEGALVAKEWWGAQGWVFHHNTDIWRKTTPSDGDVLWSAFPSAAAWTMIELYDLWKFDGDVNKLDRIVKLQEGAVDFWLSSLVKDPKTGKWLANPDIYFENMGRKWNGERVILCSGAVSTTIIVRQLFEDYLEASVKIDDVDNARIVRVQEMLEKMIDVEINRKGEIKQWHQDNRGNYVESDPTQMLAMVGAIYSDKISASRSPELVAAMNRMLEKRQLGLKEGQASWRAAFPANTYARFGQGNKMKRVLEGNFSSWLNPNATTQFIQSDWEIDGNLGLMGAINESLIQSHEDKIVLLPALPDAWAKQGSVKGLKVRGGAEFSFSWKDGVVTDWSYKGDVQVPIVVNGKL